MAKWWSLEMNDVRLRCHFKTGWKKWQCLMQFKCDCLSHCSFCSIYRVFCWFARLKFTCNHHCVVLLSNRAITYFDTRSTKNTLNHLRFFVCFCVCFFLYFENVCVRAYLISIRCVGTLPTWLENCAQPFEYTHNHQSFTIAYQSHQSIRFNVNCAVMMIQQLMQRSNFSIKCSASWSIFLVIIIYWWFV